jgi:hypothetical protein
MSRRHRKKTGTSQSVDLTGPLKPVSRRNTLKGLGLPSMSSLYGPAASMNTRRLASADEDDVEGDVPSSGQASPTDELRNINPFSVYGGKSEDNSAINLSSVYDYDTKLAGLDHKRPWGNRLTQSRVTSWSDPVSARGDGSRENMLKGEKRYDQKSQLSSSMGLAPTAWTNVPVERQDSESTGDAKSDCLGPRNARLERYARLSLSFG